MDFTVVEQSPLDPNMSRRRSSGGSTSGTAYNSRSLERPKKQKIARQSSPSSGTAAVIKSLSVGKSVSSGLNHLEVEALTTYDSEENMLGDYDMTVPHSGLERSMTSDESYYAYKRPTAIPTRMRTATSPANMMDSRLNRNSHLAESCRVALAEHTVPIPSTHDPYSKRLQQCRAVIDEIVNTERTYVLLLNDILRGYRDPLNVRMHELPISVADATVLFGEIMEIRNFNRGLLDSVEKCGHDLKRLGECFLQTWSREEGCDVYSKYCTKYPHAVEVYSRCMHNPVMLDFFKKCQHDIGHPLPLGSDLLEPVQRVLRYHILLKKILNNLREEENGYKEVKSAHETMTGVAEQINEMKRKHEAMVHVQEIQSQLVGWTGNDLTTYGDLIKEDSFKYYAGRGVNIPFRGTDERYVFLFKKLILLSKRREDAYKYKGHISWTDLQLIETLERYPNSFQVKQLSTGTIHTFHAKTDSVKMGWVVAIKNMIVESIPALSKRSKTKDLLVKGAKKTDMSPDNITGDFRGSKSASMHGLDEIKSSSRENSPRTSTSRLANSLTVKATRTLPKKLQIPKKSVDDSSLPNRHSIVSDSGIYQGDSGPENGIVMENSHSMDFTLSHTVEQQQQQQQQKQHTSLSHSKSAVLNKLQQSEDKPHKLPRNFSDSSIQEVTKRSTSPTDSMYSSDSIGSSLDIQDNVEGGRGTRGTSPANLDNPTTEPPDSPQFQGAKTRLSGRRRKPRPTSFAESDDIPEEDVPASSRHGNQQAVMKTRAGSTEPILQGGSHDNNESSVVIGNSPAHLTVLTTDPMLASLDDLGDSLLKEVIAGTYMRPPSTNSTGGRASATPTTVTTVTSGGDIREVKSEMTKSKLRRKPSNELGQELKDDILCSFEGNKLRRETLEQDMQTTVFDESINMPPSNDVSINLPQDIDESMNPHPLIDESINLPPPDDSVDQTTSFTSIDRYILTPPHGFQLNGDQPGLSPTTSEGFFTPSASPLPTSTNRTAFDVPSCDVAPIRDENSGSHSTSEPTEVDNPLNGEVNSGDQVSKRSSVALSISSVGSVDSPGRPELTEDSNTSTPEQRHRVVTAKNRHRPLSTCSADSISSEGSPRGVRRKSPAQGMLRNSSPDSSPGISRLAVVDNTAADKSSLQSFIPSVSVRDEDSVSTSSSPNTKRETTVSKLLAEMGIKSGTGPEGDSDKVSLDEILPYLDQCAADKMSTPPNAKTSLPTIVIDPGSGEVKRRTKSSKSPRMSPMRRRTTSDFSSIIEAQNKEVTTTKIKSPGTRVKKIARDYSQKLKDKGKISRFQSFTTRPGYTALDDSPGNSPKIPQWRKEIKDIQTLAPMDDSDDESTLPSRPPWLEEAKRIREIRKSQTSPSGSSRDSVDSAPPKVETNPTLPPSSSENVSRVGEPLNPALQKNLNNSQQSNSKEDVFGRKLSCPESSSRRSHTVLSDAERKARSRLSLSPSDYEMVHSDLFHIKELSKSSENISRSVSVSEIKPTFFSPRQSRSLKSFLRASNSPSARRSFSADVKDVSSPPPTSDNVDYEQVHRRGGFKGFVKNIVDRFSGKSH